MFLDPVRRVIFLSAVTTLVTGCGSDGALAEGAGNGGATLTGGTSGGTGGAGNDGKTGEGGVNGNGGKTGDGGATGSGGSLGSGGESRSAGGTAVVSGGGMAGTGGRRGRGGSGGLSSGGASQAGSAGMTAAGGAPEGDAGPVPVSACGGEKPGPTNTGVPKGTALTKSGSITVSKDGQIVENLDIAGTITVLANDVIIRKVHIKTGDYYPIRYFDGNNTGLLIEDSEIEGTSGNVTSSAAFAHYTARRLNVHGGADGLKADSDALIENCWIHDLSNGEGEHNDGVQSTGGKGVTIRGNSISGGSNSCVQTGDEHAATQDLTVECNWLGGGGYTLNIRGVDATRPSGTKVVNNVFTKDAQYGPWTIDDPSPVVTGNVYEDGTPIPYR